eukprot:366562-Chlamydomonas_euryale.AAC.9
MDLDKAGQMEACVSSQLVCLKDHTCCDFPHVFCVIILIAMFAAQNTRARILDENFLDARQPSCVHVCAACGLSLLEESKYVFHTRLCQAARVQPELLPNRAATPYCTETGSAVVRSYAPLLPAMMTTIYLRWMHLFLDAGL